jgi:Ca-activated chloride channel family protein
MRLAHPEALLLLALIPLYLGVSWLVGRLYRRRLARLLPSAEQQHRLRTLDPRRGPLRHALISGGLLLAVLALARPQLGFDYAEVERRGVDVVLAVDVSTSMLARDVAPDRLGRAKHAALRLLDRLGGDRVAVLPFAGSSTLRWPLSFDHGAAAMLIEAVNAESVTEAGSGLKAAVEGALKLFTTDDRYQKVLVIFSDGEDLAGGFEEAGRQAAQQKLIIHTVGIGGAVGVPIPLPGEGQEFKRDRAGQIVHTRAEPEPLQVLSGLSGGVYTHATYAENEIDQIAKRIDSLSGREMKKGMIVRYKEQYQWFLAPAVALLALEGALGRRRRNKR